MGALRRLLAVSATLAVLSVGLASAALASAASVTLSASETTVPFGAEVTLSGAVSPAAGAETVQILDDTGAVVAKATTDGSGSYSVAITPDRELTLHAVWQTAESDPVTLLVRSAVTVRMSAVRLFDTVTIRGKVAPAVPGASVRVSLVRAGEQVATATPRMGSAGGFDATFRVMQPGAYRGRASFADETHLRGSALDGPSTTPLPSLREGSHSVYVGLLERRLVELHYRLVAVDHQFDFRTADAVVAFRKEQRMERVFTVDEGVWRALADPFVPKPRLDVRAFHIEVDQTRQLLYTVQDHEVTNILHISSGKPSTPTHDGSFRVARKIAGFSANHLYYPSFFDGNRAIHGWTEVPTYPASHGCVRVPYWNAKWIYGLAPIGTRVIVYH